MSLLMICLHMAICQGCLVLWAEQNVVEEVKYTKKRGRKPKNPPPERHPFALGEEEFLSRLSPLSVDFSKNQFEQCLVWLPSGKKLPLASNPIVADHVSDSVELKPWEVSGLVLNSNQWIHFLKLFKDKILVASGIIAGTEIAYLHELYYFALSLVIKETFLPEVNGWEAVYSESDQQRLQALITRLPSACRALCLSRKQKDPPSRCPKEVVTSFINCLISLMIRSAAVNHQSSDATNHDQWMSVLLQPSENLNQERKLRMQIKEWKRPLTAMHSSPFRFCFRLEDPQEMGKEWKVHYLLQDQADPSLCVDIQDVWNPKGARRKVLERKGFDPRQFTLTMLGMASAFSPQIEKSLEQEVPIGLKLDSKGVYSFLKEPLINSSGSVSHSLFAHNTMRLFGPTCPSMRLTYT